MKKPLTLLCVLLCVLMPLQAKKIKDYKTLRLTYQTSFNNKPDSLSYTLMEISGGVARISSVNKQVDADAPVQYIYLDYNNNKEIKTARFKDGQFIYAVRSFELEKNTSGGTDVANVSGYDCSKMEKTINSNKLEVWYTSQFNAKGSMQPGVAIPDGVVLRVLRNGQREEKVTKVETLQEALDLLPDLTGGKELTARAYNYRLQQSRVLSVDVFDHESIYFRDMPNPHELSETQVMRFANGTILMRKVKLPQDNTGYSIFAELSQYSEGDAYDRTGSVFVVPVDRKKTFLDGLLHGKESLPVYADKQGGKYEGMVVTDDYLPAVELMRFYTSFGVRGFNKIEVADYVWPDSVVYKQEVTDYAKLLKGEVWIGTWIGNYSQNGHNVSLKIKYYPSAKGGVKEMYPLFTTANIMEMGGQAYPEGMFRNDSLTVTFKTDTDLKNAYIRYISTGHGGWGGGDEFNPKLNEIFLNGKRLMAYTPWREDCASYRNLNPASGNFANGLSSSDLSRSGWCPGVVSYPVMVPVGDVKAGVHQLKLAIPVGDPEGTSRSYWCTSGVLVGEKK